MSHVNGALIDPNQYLDFVGPFSSDRSNSYSTSSSSAYSPQPKRSTLYDDANEHTHVKRVNEILDTCLLDSKQQLDVVALCPTPACHKTCSFTCKICLSKFTLSGTKSVVSVNNNNLLFASSSLDSPPSARSSSSSLASLGTSSQIETDDNRVFQIESCKCKFCVHCLNLYIKQSIKNFNVSPLHCPDSKCGAKGFLSQAEIKYLLDGPTATSSFIGDINDNLVLASGKHNSELFDKYLKICENIEILRNPNKIHCPQPHCQNVCLISNSSNEGPQPLRNLKVSCDKCHYEFCSTCFKKWNMATKSDARQSNDKYDDDLISSIVADDAPLNTTSIFLEKSPVMAKKSEKGQSSNTAAENEFGGVDDVCECELHSDLEQDDETALARHKPVFGNLENIKRCPKCSVLIEKADGCAQIMCKMCKHTFCFYCLTSLDNDFLLKHYTKNGPCKGKLGHSRLSLLFHRFSVIAIFGGTILLIILLSPFLLLSLPCLVFSRKFRKSCFKLSSKFG